MHEYCSSAYHQAADPRVEDVGLTKVHYTTDC
jgi:hypothetical protein